MSETSIPVQPAPSTSPAGVTTTPVPLPLKMFTVIDGNGNPIYVQGVCVVDDSGRPITPMTDDQGGQIILLLKQLIKTIQENGMGGGGLAPMQTDTGLEQEGI